MASAAGIKTAAATRADRFACEILVDGQLSAATAAQNSARVEFIACPNSWLVSGACGVTFIARKPLLAAFEFDGDNIELAVIVGAARLGVNFGADDALAVN